MKESKWSGGLVDWQDGKTCYISVVFSWQMQKAFSKSIFWRSMGYDVVVGGPAVYYRPKMFAQVATVSNGLDDVVSRHNPNATFTSKGCIRNCPFCIVPTAEGDLIEFDSFPIRPIVCDNNFLAVSRNHFDRVIDKLKSLHGIDFNQGLDARLLTAYHADRLRELDIPVVRLAWDHIGIENQFMRSWELLIEAGFKPSQIQSYVLFNFNDTPEDALYRLQTIKNMGGYPNPMRYQPLDSDKRNQYVHPNWTEHELRRFMRYWSRLKYLEFIDFKDYKHGI